MIEPRIMRIVLYPNPDEPSEWAAHSLEMDLMGFGTTFGEAVRELIYCMEMQSRCADNPEQVWFPAPVEIQALAASET